jgi:hypothetical protein
MICPACNSDNPDSAAYCSRCGTSLGSAEADPVGDRCYIHPGMETALRCGNCERPICVQCMVQHPVGIRCRECARLRMLPQFDVPTASYARALGAGLGIAVAGTVGLLLMISVLPFLMLALIGLVGISYLIGEGISRAANRKRSRGLQYIAAGSVLLSALPMGVIIIGNLYGLLALAAAVYMAVSRLRTP